MTSVAETGRQPAGWGRRLVWIALALSLTLNVCVVGGALWIRMERRAQLQAPLQRLAEEVARQVTLTPQESAAFERFTRVVREDGAALRQRNEPLIQSLWDEIGKPQPDPAAVSSKGAEAANNRRAYTTAVAAALTAFLTSLPPEKRARFVEIAKSRQDLMARRLWQSIVPW